jgi:hypothetical protein
LTINGTASCTSGTWTSSDKVFKTNIDSLRNALTIIRQLKPKTYYFDTVKFKEFNFISNKQYGFLAQDIEQVLPELVKSTTKGAETDSLGNIVHPALTYKAINYTELIGILTKGIQEQQKSIDNLSTENHKQDSINAYLQNEINQLTNNLNKCCILSHSMLQNNTSNNNTIAASSSVDVNLKDGQSVILDQNVPNPFAEQTTINYFLPDNVSKAQMLFYNADGKLIQSIELAQKGKGSVNVFAQDLSNGIYTYTLVVDGKIFETKKMVKQ